jgi:hypothetical protein
MELKGIKKYGTVEAKVRKVAESIGEDVEYLFMNWSQANVAMDAITKPSVVYVLPPSGKLDFSYARVKDYPETQIGFLAPTDFDFDGTENDNIIEQMKRLAIKFIKALNASKCFELIEGKQPYQVVYDFLDQNVTGIVLNLPLEEVDGIIICEEESRYEDENEGS